MIKQGGEMCLLFMFPSHQLEKSFTLEIELPICRYRRKGWIRMCLIYFFKLLYRCAPTLTPASSLPLLNTGLCSCLSTYMDRPYMDNSQSLPLLCPVHLSFSMVNSSSLPKLRTPVTLIVCITHFSYTFKKYLLNAYHELGIRYSAVNMTDAVFA